MSEEDDRKKTSMRLNYYRFPKGTDESARLKEGCTVFLSTGQEIHPKNISKKLRPLVDMVDDICGPMTLAAVKNLMKKYGGTGYTEYYDLDGELFETAEIHLPEDK